jgi:hypothetical protein
MYAVCEKAKYIARFEVAMLMSLKSAIFWDVMPCSLVKVYSYFKGMYCLHLHGQRVS